jgi:hypothetical protein
MAELFAEFRVPIILVDDNVASRLEIALTVTFRPAIFRLESELMRTNMTGDRNDRHARNELTTTAKNSKRGESFRARNLDTSSTITFSYKPLPS